MRLQVPQTQPRPDPLRRDRRRSCCAALLVRLAPVRDPRPRGAAARRLRHARALDVPAGRAARVPRDGGLRRAGRARARRSSSSPARSPARARPTSTSRSRSSGSRRGPATRPASSSAAGSGASSSSATGRSCGSPRSGSSRSRATSSDHGGKTILIGRFIGLVRALAPFVAGSSGMRYRAFVPYSVLGTGLWAAAFSRARLPRLAEHRADRRRRRAGGAAVRDHGRRRSSGSSPRSASCASRPTARGSSSGWSGGRCCGRWSPLGRRVQPAGALPLEPGHAGRPRPAS